jgi:hypothetical protein
MRRYELVVRIPLDRKNVATTSRYKGALRDRGVSVGQAQAHAMRRYELVVCFPLGRKSVATTSRYKGALRDGGVSV